MSRVARLALALLVLAPMDAALAGGARTFQEGLLHPLVVPAHVLAVLGTGLLVGQQGSRWGLLAPGSYVAGLAIGFATMIAAVAPVFAAEAILAAAAISGALVALSRPLPALLGCALALTTGVALALDSSPGGISVPDANVVLTGTFCGAVILLLAVVRLTTMLCRTWQRTGVRILGSWIAASAIMVLASTLAT